MISPSISMCGVFCISSRSLNVPGSDSSALQTRYLSIEPCGRNETFLPICEPRAAAPAQAGGFQFLEHVLGAHLQRLAQRLVSAAGFVDGERVQTGLVDAVEQELAGHAAFAPVSAQARFTSCLSGSTSRPARTSSSSAGTSAVVSGPT